MMMDIDSLVGRMVELESKYDELLRLHQSLIHEYEELKAKYEKACVGHRNIDGSPYDTLGNH